MNSLDPAELHSIEALVDKHGLAHMLDALGVIAQDKAAHIVENWQDRPTASLWSRAAARILAIVDPVANLVSR
jgi:hypothetical protein